MAPVAFLVVLIVTLGGCATEGKVTDPSVYIGNPFHRPTESGFRDMARAGCGSMSIGDSTVGALLGKNQAFDGLISALYQGDISNDEFMNQVLLQHPAADANIHATGCIMDQLAQCFAETCKAEAAVERQSEEAENDTEAEKIRSAVTIDPSELPTEDLPEIDGMIEQSKEEDGPKPLP
ncbi:hypothetical protein [Halochromatium salexigens]|uniref:Uncharacterized protein n=1 Tax=Halochromatium salexigens TaxID=49447 RepID=A0AAJ0XEQ6_HALSE|nr:hypothetical protein [Halochromatium salexigens]MBK5929536.1 hypothetical protein [Halochromatium salexigens]